MLQFNLKPKPHATLTQTESSLCEEYDGDPDDIIWRLSVVCHAMENKITFHVEGFGQNPWPADVGTDFCTFVEQLPDLLTWLDRDTSDPFALDLYEQGMERRLTFHRHRDIIKVVCESWAAWEPDPQEEQLARSDLESMLGDVANRFVAFVRDRCPDVYAEPWFISWIHQPSFYKRLNLSD